jgi:hypothetical protein
MPFPLTFLVEKNSCLPDLPKTDPWSTETKIYPYIMQSKGLKPKL